MICFDKLEFFFFKFALACPSVLYTFDINNGSIFIPNSSIYPLSPQIKELLLLNCRKIPAIELQQFTNSNKTHISQEIKNNLRTVKVLYYLFKMYFIYNNHSENTHVHVHVILHLRN